MSKRAYPSLLNQKATALVETILSQVFSRNLQQATSLLFSSPFAFPPHVYSLLFRLCASNSAIIETRKVVSHLRTFWDQPPTFLLNRAIEVYSKCGSLRDARQLFDELPHRNGGGWNAIITAYSQAGFSEEVLRLFVRMNQSGLCPNEVTLAGVLGSCSGHHAYESALARQIHGLIVRYGFVNNVILASSLVDLYGKYGDIKDGRKLFDDIKRPNLVSWNIIVRRYLEAGDETEAIRMFFKMFHLGSRPLSHTFSSALVACSSIPALIEGMQIHGKAIKVGFDNNEAVSSSLIDLYVKSDCLEKAWEIFDQSPILSKDVISLTCMVSGYASHGRTREARELFNKIPNRNIISWNAMLAGYTRNCEWEEALEFIFFMRKEEVHLNQVSLSLILNVCSALSNVDIGRQIHAYLYRCGMNNDPVLGNAILNMYGKCGRFKSCDVWFNEMDGFRDRVSWNSMMYAYESHQLGEAVIRLFANMLEQKDMIPDNHTFATLLSACANISALRLGKSVHGFIMRNGYDIDDTVVIAAMCDMYSKCRCFDYSIIVFKMRVRVGDKVLWNTMIFGCCHHGRGYDAIELFELMKEMGVEPDHVTFEGILQACVLEGCVDQGRRYFDSMSDKFYLMPRLEHYEAIIELYSRHGAMDELERFLKALPFDPTDSMLKMTVDACQKYGCSEFGD